MKSKSHLGVKEFVLIGSFGLVQVAIGEDVEELLNIYGSEKMISLATGYRQPLSLAPSVGTVITEDDIEAIGAITLAQVLETVPGLTVASARGLSDIFVIRGFSDELNRYVLLLINGIPVTDPVNGGRPQAWAMPVHNIARVEIIRGPGSALYGADAAAGVINVITKTADDIEGTEIGAYGGSDETYGGWLLTSWQGENINAALSLQASTTNGYDETIEVDNQTRIDRLLGTSASLAPGPINTQRDDINARVDVAGPRWRFRAGYQGFLNVGTGAGITLALDPEGDFSVQLFNTDLSYTLVETDELDVQAQASYLSTKTEANVMPYPPGTFGGLFPEGIREKFQLRVEQVRAEVTALYKAFQNHTIRFGAGINYAETNDVEEKRNFVTGPSGLPRPVPFVNVAALGEEAFIQEENRTVWYGFVQDEWRILPDWILTSGIRIDHFSDFGTAVNPRLSLVWNVSPATTARLLYGRSFRAPSFTELYGNNLVAAIGNADLDPEILDTVELALDKRWGMRLQTNANFFYYRLDDQIGAVNRPQETALLQLTQRDNTSGIEGYGLELEAELAVTDTLTLLGNYAYQITEDRRTNTILNRAAENQLYTAVDWRMTPLWALNARVNWIDETRFTDDYSQVGLTLRRSGAQDGLDFSLAIENLFDETGHTSSLNPRALPLKLPLPGRQVIAKISWQF